MTHSRVVILQETLPRYRVKLLSEVTRIAAGRGITVRILHGHAPGMRGARLGTGKLPGAKVVRNRYMSIPGIGKAAVWQSALRACLGADLVVVEQANRLLINYVLLLLHRIRGSRLAFWGHGRNMQGSPTTLPERLKSRMAAAPNWWFAYTQHVAEYLIERGMPASRITIVGNTIDVMALRDDVERERAGGDPAPSGRCVFLGGLYSHKRLDFLFAAADLVAKRLPDFELHIAGSGEEQHSVERFVQERPWAHYLGPVEGARHAALLASARLLLAPGLVGLVVLDSFAAGVPLVTTSDALHSPEVEYIQSGLNGLITPPTSGPEDYADVVEALLMDPLRWQAISDGARASAERHTVEAAAKRFVDGLAGALTAD